MYQTRKCRVHVNSLRRRQPWQCGVTVSRSLLSRTAKLPDSEIGGKTFLPASLKVRHPTDLSCFSSPPPPPLPPPLTLPF